MAFLAEKKSIFPHQNAVPSGKLTYEKSPYYPYLMNQSTIHGNCSIARLVHQRVGPAPSLCRWAPPESLGWVVPTCLGMAIAFVCLRVFPAPCRPWSWSKPWTWSINDSMVIYGDLKRFNGHFRYPNWRYLQYLTPIFGGHGKEYPHKL